MKYGRWKESGEWKSKSREEVGNVNQVKRYRNRGESETCSFRKVGQFRGVCE
jgi:hypothetical protein